MLERVHRDIPCADRAPLSATIKWGLEAHFKNDCDMRFSMVGSRRLLAAPEADVPIGELLVLVVAPGRGALELYISDLADARDA